MLVSSKLASIPCSPRHSITNLRDIPGLLQNNLVPNVQPPVTPSLQFFNMRVTERLHRYRSLKRHWYEVTTAAQNESTPSPKSDSPLPVVDVTSLAQEHAPETKASDVKDNITPTTTTTATTTTIRENNDRNVLEISPVHSRIQQDLIELRKLIKTTQKRRIEVMSSRQSAYPQLCIEASTNMTFEDQETFNSMNVKQPSSLNKAKLYERVAIFGSNARPSTFPQSHIVNHEVNAANNLLGTEAASSKQREKQKMRQKVNSKTFNICRSRISACLQSESSVPVTVSPKKKMNVSPKSVPNMSPKSTESCRMPISPVVKKREPSFVRHKTVLPSAAHSSHSEQPTTCAYTYAASTSSASPSSMKFSRNTSLLPILLASVSCIGAKSGEIKSRTLAEKTKDDSHNLMNYKELISHLPKPIISIRPRYNQDEYGILFEQLDHMRETMPSADVYDNYTRVC